MSFWPCPLMLGYGCVLGVSAGSSNAGQSMIQMICWNSAGATQFTGARPVLPRVALLAALPAQRAHPFTLAGGLLVM